MYCCEKCFKDIEIKAIVKAHAGDNVGSCSFCSSSNVPISDITENEYLKEAFETLLDVYTPISSITDDYPRENSDLLKNILRNQWSLFHLGTDNIYRFLVNLFPDKYSEQPDLFDSPVGISGSVKSDYLKEYSLLGTHQWEDFVTEIKEKNRFHTNIINKDILLKILRAICKCYKTGQTFFRARIWTDDRGFEKQDMGAPPAKLASAGRANPEGISCLYLADSANTTLHETRAGVYDCATVAKFNYSIYFILHFFNISIIVWIHI